MSYWCELVFHLCSFHSCIFCAHSVWGFVGLRMHLFGGVCDIAQQRATHRLWATSQTCDTLCLSCCHLLHRSVCPKGEQSTNKSHLEHTVGSLFRVDWYGIPCLLYLQVVCICLKELQTLALCRDGTYKSCLMDRIVFFLRGVVVFWTRVCHTWHFLTRQWQQCSLDSCLICVCFCDCCVCVLFVLVWVGSFSFKPLLFIGT